VETVLKLVLLPGMDGVGLLFEPFLAVLPPDIEVEVFPLASQGVQDYHEQAELFAKKLTSTSTVILAESYSGRVAYELCQMDLPQLKGVIFAASFLSRPSALLGLTSLAPAFLLKAKLLPDTWMGRLLFGQFQSKELVKLFYRSIQQVEGSVLKQRLLNMAALQCPEAPIRVPSIYIQAKGDTLVQKSAVKDFESICSNLEVHQVDGGHLLLQANPKACWDIVRNAFWAE